jgi:hypothetical protein
MNLKNILAACMAASFVVLLASCVNLPKFKSPASPPAPGPAMVATTFHPSQAVPTASSTVAETAHAEAVLFWIVGIVLILGSGALFYFQFYLAGAKVLIAGIALPVVGTIWSQHYAIIICASLVGLAIWYMLTHQAAVSAIAKTIGTDAGDVLADIKGLAGVAALKTNAPAPVSAGALNTPGAAKGLQ